VSGLEAAPGGASAAERPSIEPRTRLVLASQLLMNTANFMAFPFLAVYLRRNLGFSPGEIGTVLTVYLISARVLPGITGAFADRAGSRWVMALGMAVRAVGFVGISLLHGMGALVATALLIGLGGAIYDPAVDAVFAAQPESIRPRVFTIHVQLLNVGVVIGPALGGLLVGVSPRTPFLGSAALFAALAVALLVFAPAAHGRARTSLGHSYRTVLSNRAFVWFCAAMVLWWFLFAQLSISFPIKAVQITGDERSVTALFLVNGVVGILALFGVRRLAERRPPTVLLAWGFLFVAAGFGLIAALSSIWWLTLCMAIYTVGESVMFPCADLKIASFVTERTSATFFGVYIVTWAVGGTAGNYAGSWLVVAGGRFLPWIVYGLVGLAGAWAITAYRARWERAGAEPVAVEAAEGAP
jgi:predicted MFS family arabinose efflux permease